MNLLFLSTWFPYPPDNGSKLRALYLLRSLAVQHEVTALAFHPLPGNGDAPTNADDVPVIAVPDDPFRHVDAPQWVKYLSPTPLVFRASPAMHQAAADLAARPWDAVVAVQMPVAQYALQVNAPARIVDVDTALTFQMHERYLSMHRPIARASAWVSWQKAYRYERRMLRRFQAAAVVTQAEIAPLQAMVDGTVCRVALIANGVDCAHNRPGLAQPRPASLVYNGSLTYSANYDAVRWFLAEVYPRIRAQVPDVTLTITGSTEGVDLAGLALDDSVHLTGFVRRRAPPRGRGRRGHCAHPPGRRHPPQDPGGHGPGHAGGGHVQGRGGAGRERTASTCCWPTTQNASPRTSQRCWLTPTCALAWPPTPAAWSSSATTGTPSAGASWRW